MAREFLPEYDRSCRVYDTMRRCLQKADILELLDAIEGIIPCSRCLYIVLISNYGEEMKHGNLNVLQMAVCDQ